MEEYLYASRWFIHLRPFMLKIDRLESLIYEDTGDSYDMPEPHVIDSFMRMNCNCLHVEYMLAVF